MRDTSLKTIYYIEPKLVLMIEANWNLHYDKASLCISNQCLHVQSLPPEGLQSHPQIFHPLHPASRLHSFPHDLLQQPMYIYTIIFTKLQPAMLLEVRYCIYCITGVVQSTTNETIYVPYTMRLYKYHIQWDYIRTIYNETIYVQYTMRLYTYHIMRLYTYYIHIGTIYNETI